MQHGQPIINIGTVCHCNNIPVRSRPNPIRAVIVISNRFGPSGEVRADVGFGTP
jgi:hypothetical protein